MSTIKIQLISCFFNFKGVLMSHVFTNIKPTKNQLPKLEGLISNLWTTGIERVKKDKHVICFTMFMNYPIGIIDITDRLYKFKKIMEFDTLPSKLKLSNRILDVPQRVKNKIKDACINTPVMEMDAEFTAEDVFQNSVRRISVDSSYLGDDEDQGPKLTIQKTIPQSGELLTVEMMKNIEMLKSINFIQHLKYTVVGDKVLLNQPCGFAIGDYITNRHLSYEDKFGIHQRSSRIHDDHWPSVLSKKYLMSIGVCTNLIIMNSL